MPKHRFKVCVCWRRVFKTRMVKPSLDIKNAFYSFSPSGVITVDDLLRFLIEHQGQKNATKEDAQVIFDSLKHLNIFQRRGIHLEAFFRYLIGDLNPAHPPSNVHHDMNAPLSHYFLFTDHNSYLTGNQFSSASSVELIKDVLHRGVRVIELDLWPNSSGNDVNDSDFFVGLQKFLEAIKENTFKALKYPIIITFKYQLNPNLQEKVAKKKVLISTKLLKEYLEGNTQGEEILENEGGTAWNPPEEREHVLDEDEEKVVPEYRQLIATNARKLKGGLENWLSDDPKKGHGKHLWIMQGMFRANGGCSYVKKPNFLLHMGPNDEVKIYLGEGWHQDFHHTAFDRSSPPDFYTREFKFQLRAPKLTVLRIKIMDNNTTGRHYFGGQ
ncbi:hypothetical protein Goklo_010465, partial [Gossypium klotzschianum]|nr:hypothetical protein [Gossypium klotzschianum]